MDLKALLAAPYNRRWFQAEDGSWSADVAELDGVFASGASAEEAIANLSEAMELWFEVETEEGRPIPAPWGSKSHSGTLNLRLPGSLHQSAAYRAKLEGVSLNQFLVAAVATYVHRPSYVGWDPEQDSPKVMQSTNQTEIDAAQSA